MLALTRRYRFAAAHVLRRPELSDDENRRLYGKCANPNGHGHDYGLEVTVSGEVDARTGWLVEPQAFDRVVRERVLSRLDRRRLNDEAWFRDCVPTAENIVRRAHAELAEALAAECGVRLVRVRLVETRRNGFECGEGR